MKSIGYVFFSFLLISLFCCAGVQYQDQAKAIDLNQSNEKQTAVKILAKAEEWRNSGVIVKEGFKYKISTKGRWRASPTCGWTGAGGVGAYNPLCWDLNMSIIKGWSISALIAKIGENGKPFVVGDEYELKAEESGILYFRINDLPGYCGDNDGLIQAKTSLFRPEPPTPKRSTEDQIKISEKSYYAKDIGQNWAVIIGLSQYKYAGQSGLTNLIFADDDAKAFARVLRNLGWSESHIKLLINKEATQRNIMIALESWLTKAGPNDQIVLFWAGHGFPDPEDPEKVYFACYDTDISIPVTGYRMDRVRAALEERKSRNVVLLADTCHAGKLITRGKRGLSIVPKIEKMHREQNTPKGWVFMVGADTDRKAIEHTSWNNGAFTHCLLNALSGKADGYLSSGAKDGIVTMGELRAYMNVAMPDETQKVLGVAKRAVITTSTGDPDIWNLTLEVK